MQTAHFLRLTFGALRLDSARNFYYITVRRFCQAIFPKKLHKNYSQNLCNVTYLQIKKFLLYYNCQEEREYKPTKKFFKKKIKNS